MMVKLVLMLPQANRIASVDALVRAAEAAESLGFHGISVRDHLVFNGWWISSGMRGADVEGDDRDMFEGMQTLAFLAARTTKVRLETSVMVVPNRHPLVLAKQVATLDVLSGGRLTLGVGMGPPLRPDVFKTTVLGGHLSNVEKEHRAVGVPGPRGPRMNEYLEAMISIWTQERATYRGTYVRFEDLEVFPKPIQTPHPPILVGGRSEAALQRAARYGVGWVPSQVAAEEVGAGVRRLTELRAELGKPPAEEVGPNLWTALAETDDQAHEMAYPTVSNVFPDEDEYRRRTIVGSPETFARRIAEYGRAGATFIEMRPIYPSIDHLIEQMRRLTEDVLPVAEALQASPAA